MTKWKKVKKKMGLKKGQASKAFLDGKMEKYNFKNLSEEEKHEIAMKGVQARVEKMKARKAMKEQLELLLSLDVTKDREKERLAELGFYDNEMNNQLLLVTALFKKALTGDVAAFKQINDILNGVDAQVDSTSVQAPVINIISTSSKRVKNKDGSITIEDDEEWEEEE